MTRYQVIVYYGGRNATVTNPHGDGWTDKVHYLIDARNKLQAERISRVMHSKDFPDYRGLVKQVTVNE